MSVEKFKERLKLFDDNDEIIENLFFVVRRSSLQALIG